MPPTPRLRILVLDAMHPDENPAGETCDALYESLINDPIPGVHAEFGNRDAYNKGIDPKTGKLYRYADNKLSIVRALPNPDGDSEDRRMAQLEELFPQYDLIIDRHGNGTVDGDFAFTGEEVSPVVSGAIALMGLKRVVHFRRNSPHMVGRLQMRNYLGVDLSTNSELTVPRLREIIKQLAQRALPSVTPPLEHYEFLESIPAAKARRFKIPAWLKPFQAFPDALADLLGYPRGTVSCGINYDNERYVGEAYKPYES